MNILKGSEQYAQNFIEPEASAKKIADLIVNGALVETKLCVYGKVWYSFF